MDWICIGLYQLRLNYITMIFQSIIQDIYSPGPCEATKMVLRFFSLWSWTLLTFVVGMEGLWGATVWCQNGQNILEQMSNYLVVTKTSPCWKCKFSTKALCAILPKMFMMKKSSLYDGEMIYSLLLYRAYGLWRNSSDFFLIYNWRFSTVKCLILASKVCVSTAISFRHCSPNFLWDVSRAFISPSELA